MEQFKDNPAPPCPHCGEDQKELTKFREDNKRMLKESYYSGFLDGFHEGAKGQPTTPQAEDDLRELRELSGYSARMETSEFLTIYLPRGNKRVEDMCEAELIEVCYLIDGVFRKVAALVNQ